MIIAAVVKVMYLIGQYGAKHYTVEKMLELKIFSET